MQQARVYAPAPQDLLSHATPNGHCLQLGLLGYPVEQAQQSIELDSISNPNRSPSFRPSPSDTFQWDAFAIHPDKTSLLAFAEQVVLGGLKDLTPTRRIPPTFPVPKPCSIPSTPDS